MKNCKYLLIIIVFFGIHNVARSQSSQVLPDSILTTKLITDNVVAEQGRVDSLITGAVTSQKYLIAPLYQPLDNLPLFVNQDTTTGRISTRADSFAVSIPATLFRPENADTDPSSITPDYDEFPIITKQGLAWGIIGFYPLVGPLHVGLNHLKNNIRVKEFEVCVWDSNSEMDLMGLLHESYFSDGATFDEIKMTARSIGGADTNRGCFKGNLTTDDFDLNQHKKTYWIEVVPVSDNYKYNSSDPPVNDEFGNWPPLVTGLPNTATGKLRLLNARVFYSHQ